MDTGDSNPQIVGHIWRYDLAPAGPSGTKTTLSYDWSAVPGSLRQRLPFPFPPFAPDHLTQLAGSPRRTGHRITGQQAGQSLPLAALSPAYAEVTQLDMFRDEDLAYTLRLGQAGVPAGFHLHPGAPHEFDFIAFNTTGAPPPAAFFEHRMPPSLTGGCRAASPDK